MKVLMNLKNKNNTSTDIIQHQSIDDETEYENTANYEHDDD